MAVQDAVELRGSISDDLEIVEMRGVIKWYDASKGYGFITPDSGGRDDVFFHCNCVRECGYTVAREGARVRIQAISRPKGLQAHRILEMDESTLIDPSQLPQRTHVTVQVESEWELAIVKWFNRIRGFGFFAQGEGKSDIFVHMETLRRYGFTELRPGQEVLVRWGTSIKGRMAAELKPV